MSVYKIIFHLLFSFLLCGFLCAVDEKSLLDQRQALFDILEEEDPDFAVAPVLGVDGGSKRMVSRYKNEEYAYYVSVEHMANIPKWTPLNEGKAPADMNAVLNSAMTFAETVMNGGGELKPKFMKFMFWKEDQGFWEVEIYDEDNKNFVIWVLPDGTIPLADLEPEE